MKGGEKVAGEILTIHGAPSRADAIGQRCDTICVKRGGRLYTLMIDCGIEFRREDEIGGVGPIPDLAILEDRSVDAVFLTHSHADHIGAIAAAVAQNKLRPGARIVSTPQTSAILPFALQDGLKHDAGYYSIFDAVEVLDRREVIPEPGVWELLPGLQVYLMPMGHIPGACGIVIPTSSGKRGLITGDWCRHDQPVTKGAVFPKHWPSEWIPDEIWGTDLTYGSGSKKPISEEVERLVAQTKAELALGKKVVIAAFGNGRGQNVAVWLAKAGVPVWLDGVIRRIYLVFQETSWAKGDGKLPKIGLKSKIQCIESEEHREELINSKEPAVFVTTAGMGDFGPVVRYMEEGLPRQDWTFFFTSWLAPGSMGDRLLKLATRRADHYQPLSFNVEITDKYEDTKNIPFRASVDRLHLSAHGDLDDSVAMLEEIVERRGGRKLERVILTHGTFETKARAALRFRPFSEEIIYGERNTTVPLK